MGKESFLTNPVERTTGTMEEPPKGISSGYIQNHRKKLASWANGVLVSTRRSNHLSSARTARIATTLVRMSKFGSAMVTRISTLKSNDQGIGTPRLKIHPVTSSVASTTRGTNWSMSRCSNSHSWKPSRDVVMSFQSISLEELPYENDIHCFAVTISIAACLLQNGLHVGASTIQILARPL